MNELEIISPFQELFRLVDEYRQAQQWRRGQWYATLRARIRDDELSSWLASVFRHEGDLRRLIDDDNFDGGEDGGEDGGIASLEYQMHEAVGRVALCLESIGASCDIPSLDDFLDRVHNGRWSEADLLWRTGLKKRLGEIALCLESDTRGPTKIEETVQSRNRHRMSVDEANRKAMALAENDPSFVHRSQREWASAIGCSVGLVSKLPLWQQTMKLSGRRKKGRATTPKAVSFTSALENAVGERNDELQRLIGEQKADDRRRKVGSRERV